MIDLKKAQVGALLKVLSKDDTRPILTSAYVDKWEDDTVLVATNGYIFAALYLDNEDGAPLVGKLIRRDAFERWYKLATGRDRLTTQALVGLSSEDYGQHGSYQDGKYPDWQKIVPSGAGESQPEMIFNADFAKVLQDLEETDGMKWELTGRLAPMVSRTEKGVYLLMPRKV